MATWISNYIHYKVWDWITYLFTNCNGATVEVFEWICNVILHFIKQVITYPSWDLSQSMLVKGSLEQIAYAKPCQKILVNSKYAYLCDGIAKTTLQAPCVKHYILFEDHEPAYFTRCVSIAVNKAQTCRYFAEQQRTRILTQAMATGWRALQQGFP